LKIILWLISTYVFGFIATCYWLRFTKMYRDNRGIGIDSDTPLLFFFVLFWPITYPGAVIYLCWRQIKRGLGVTIFFQIIDKVILPLLRRRIHADDYGVLYRMPSPYGSEMRIVKVQDSTGIYWLSVPPNMQTAKQAVAWTYGMKEDEFYPMRV